MFYSMVEMGVHIKRIYTYFKNDIYFLLLISFHILKSGYKISY